MGIDLPKAFDCINRHKLLKEHLDNSALRIITYLLSNTKIHVRQQGQIDPKPFTKTIGVPQGDALSPVLFIIYFE